MWVGPGGFIGNFAFRFSKKQKFSSLRLSLSLNISNCSFTFYAKQAFDSRPFLFVSVFSADAVRKLRFYDQFKKKTGNTAGSHSRFLSRSRNTRENERREADFYHT